MGDMDTESGQEDDLKALYRYMRSVENKLGGGEGFEGIYGSLTKSGMQEVVKSLERNCELTKDSALVDVGSGLGRPLLHVSVSPGITKLWGIEMDSIKVQKALTFLRQVRQSMASIGRWRCHHADPPKITHAAIENIESLDSYTHGYSFWEGVPVQGKQAFGKLFSSSMSMIGVAVVQRAFRKSPELEMEKLGFYGVTLMQSIKVRMSGSNQSFNAYVFRRNKSSVPLSLPPLTPERAISNDSSNSSTDHSNNRRHSEQFNSTGDVSAVRKSLGSMALTEPPPSKDRLD